MSSVASSSKSPRGSMGVGVRQSFTSSASSIGSTRSPDRSMISTSYKERNNNFKVNTASTLASSSPSSSSSSSSSSSIICNLNGLIGRDSCATAAA